MMTNSTPTESSESVKNSDSTVGKGESSVNNSTSGHADADAKSAVSAEDKPAPLLPSSSRWFINT